MANITTKKRLDWIDAVKGLGIILIVLSHCGISNGYIQHAMLFLTAGYVSMFFVLAGYNSKEEDILPAVKKKFKRLIIPYITYGALAILLFCLLDIARGGFSGHRLLHDFYALFYSRFSLYKLGTEANVFLFPTFLSPLWFLTAMFVAYIWLYIYLQLKSKISKWLCITIYIAAHILLANNKILLPCSLDTSFLCSLLIISGYEFKNFFMAQNKMNFKYITLFIIACILYILIVNVNGATNLSVKIYGASPYMSIPLFFILTLLITYIYGETFKSFTPKSITKSFAFVGRLSLRIMCIHMPIVCLLNTLTGASPYIVFAISLFLSILLSWIAGYILKLGEKQIPLLKYL
jgi:fucose 4-O-acetylase-like acetyltransferase